MCDTVCMVLVNAASAAERLGLSVRQVQRLVAAGEIEAVGPNRVVLESVLRHERNVAGRRARPWAEATAWAAVAMLSGVDADWLAQPQTSRTTGRLRAATPESLVGACRARATVHRYWAHSAAIEPLRRRVVASGEQGRMSGLGARVDDMVDGYVKTAGVGTLVDRFLLSKNGDGDAEVVLRATSFDLSVVREIAAADQVLAALDLATSLDVRERSAGLRVLDHRLRRFA
ncbi:hypothetical protein GCM10008944_20630 [Cytobacillus oceanisediminis]